MIHLKIKEILGNPLFTTLSGMITGFILGDLMMNHFQNKEMLIIRLIKFLISYKVVVTG